MKRKVIVSLAAVLLWTVVPIVGAATVQVDGVRFDRTVDAHNQQLRIQGTGLLRVMVFVKAYAGAFYLADTTPANQALQPVAKQLVLEYFHPIKSEVFAKATRVKILDNVNAAEAERLGPSIDRLAALYQDVQPGDRYALTYVPGEGTRLALNDELLGSIPGDDFARAVFSIWLGANPIDEGFRDRLLGVS